MFTNNGLPLYRKEATGENRKEEQKRRF